MPDRMNHDHLLVMNEFVDDSVVTDSQLEQSFKFPCQCFKLNFFDVPC